MQLKSRFPPKSWPGRTYKPPGSNPELCAQKESTYSAYLPKLGGCRGANGLFVYASILALAIQQLRVARGPE